MKFLLHLVILLTLAGVVRAENKEPPVPVRTVAPEYPSEMKRNGIPGVVTISCLIDEQGNVQDAKVQKSSDGIFEQPALDALKKWKFKPAKLEGNPVAAKVSIPIKFSING